jgi:hypothetical protein
MISSELQDLITSARTLLPEQDEWRMMNSIPAGTSKPSPVEAPADYGELLTFADGLGCGNVVVFGTKWVARNQVYAEHRDGVPIELNPVEWFCFGKVNEDPLFINRKTSEVYWFPDTGVIWWMSDRFEQISANLGEFLLDQVFGPGYPALSGVDDDQWCEVLRRLHRLNS